MEIISNLNKINYNNYFLQIMDEMLDTASDRFKGLTPQSKEAYYYRQIFEPISETRPPNSILLDVEMEQCHGPISRKN